MVQTLYFQLICFFEYETIVSRNALSLGYSEKDTSKACVIQHAHSGHQSCNKKTHCRSLLEILWSITCQSLVVMVTIVPLPTVQDLIPSPSAVVCVWSAEEPNISPQVEVILWRMLSSPVMEAIELWLRPNVIKVYWNQVVQAFLDLCC